MPHHHPRLNHLPRITTQRPCPAPSPRTSSRAPARDLIESEASRSETLSSPPAGLLPNPRTDSVIPAQAGIQAPQGLANEVCVRQSTNRTTLATRPKAGIHLLFLCAPLRPPALNYPHLLGAVQWSPRPCLAHQASAQPSQRSRRIISAIRTFCRTHPPFWTK